MRQLALVYLSAAALCLCIIKQGEEVAAEQVASIPQMHSLFVLSPFLQGGLHALLIQIHPALLCLSHAGDGSW